MCKNSNNSSSFLHGVVLGATLGAVVGVLMAPEAGKETKKKVGTKVQPIIDDLKPIVAALIEVSEPKRKELTQKISGIIENTSNNS